MNDLCVNRQVVYFFRYMRLFGICLFSVLSQDDAKIHAVVAWEEDCSNGIPSPEDTQEVVWLLSEAGNLEDSLALGEVMFENNLIENDKVLIPDSNVFSELKWSIDRYQAAMQTLVSIRVPMFDEGEPTDEFLLHY